MLKTVALAWCWMSVGALQNSQREELCGALPLGAGERVLSLGFTFEHFPVRPPPRPRLVLSASLQPNRLRFSPLPHRDRP